MTAYRDDAAALRHRLELETARADRAEKKLVHFESGRDRHWDGDVALFLARALLIVVPLTWAGLFLLFFGTHIVFDVFNDAAGLAAIYAVMISPLFVAGPLAAWKTERPTRLGWGLALFTYLFMLTAFAPAALFGLAILLRGRTRDAVFGPLSTPAAAPAVRVEVESEDAEEDGAEEDAELRTSRSARAAS